MSAVLVFFDAVDGSLSSGQQELLTLAASLGEAHVVTGAADPSEALAFDGVEVVWTGESEISAPDPALVDLLETAVRESGADVVLGTDSADSTDALARLAVRLEAGLITDAVGVDGDASSGATSLTVHKSVLAGGYTTSAQVTSGPAVITVRPNSVEAALSAGAAPEVTALPVSASSSGVEVLGRTELEASERPALTEARVVVAGGRGMDGNFGPLEELADELGAAIGASRAATDAGWIDHAAQVGQTGVTVSPQLYLSAGISGAVQQRAGMQTAQTIVAINKDEDAPVFEIADFGVVGDLFEVIPQMLEELRRRKT
ncbi:MAG: electron transfer flavoprotein subunit alpha/FixB family protein [Nesterenkonia sp.]|uniref:electron transfer flavoprotein subunit alpha/FixB family protein n=1 Tax=Nesterenkonia marinintestina TaxID=2979865 RepID=UPI0021BF6A1A|nr:electron transfer flavoprotein subunit alpha/FixB family protein [Nesterenkonia sp. GX14115]MDO5493087.1 electron transfer flavoprotein subunit alpha/FixB family protein [Nesterenkonia sp.]